MPIVQSRWIRFKVEIVEDKGKTLVLHTVSCSSSAQEDLPEICHSITLTSSASGAEETYAAHNASSCRQNLYLGRKKYGGSIITVALHQTAETDLEVYTARHAPGLVLEGACRLNPILSDDDVYRYLASNADLIDGFGNDLGRARSHYQEIGRYEGRPTNFPALRYLASHPDLVHLGDDEASASKHYVEYGHREGRTVSFLPLLYLDCNPDVRAVFGDDCIGATLHYLREGRREGRRTN